VRYKPPSTHKVELIEAIVIGLFIAVLNELFYARAFTVFVSHYFCSTRGRS
jgi:hypothetical protein